VAKEANLKDVLMKGVSDGFDEQRADITMHTLRVPYRLKGRRETTVTKRQRSACGFSVCIAVR